MAKKIGNIVTKSKRHQYSNLFNVVGSLDDIDPSLPTLIVGWEIVKQLPNADILCKRIGEYWWTFGKTERRYEYEDDIVEFYKYAVTTSLNKVKYTYIDFTKYSLSKIKRVIKFAREETGKVGFLTRNSNFLFIYSEKYNTVFGVSLTLCEYLGIKKKKVISLFKHTYFIHDTSYIENDIKQIIGYNTHYILPLYSFTK